MSTADREAFMRMMGLTAADVEDPDSVPPREPSRNAAAAAAAARSSARMRKVTSPAASSVGGLSHSVSLPGEPDHAASLNATARASATARDSARAGASFHATKDREDAAPLRRSARPEYFETPPPSDSMHGNSVHRSSAAATRVAMSASAATSSSSRPATAASEALKEEGNRAFEAARFTEAITHYSAAIESLSHVTGSGARGAETELLAALHSNRSAAYLQAARQWSSAEEAFGRALCDADRAVALRPSWFKGYSRQGDAYFKLRRYGTAAESYEMALQLDPRNTTLSNALAETRQRAKQAAREEMEMRRTMRSTVNSHMSSTRSTDIGLDQTHMSSSDASSQQTPLMWATGEANKSGRRSSGQAQQLWADLKHEVETTTHAPTGDAYRLQQLERFRKRGVGAASSNQSEPRRTPDSERTRTETPLSSQRRASPQPTTADEVMRSTSSRRPAERLDSLSPAFFTTAAGSVGASAPVPPPRRSSYDSPTAGGIPAAMANFSGPVTSARDVPYEFSSAAASAYQQKLLEAFRQRKGK